MSMWDDLNEKLVKLTESEAKLTPKVADFEKALKRGLAAAERDYTRSMEMPDKERRAFQERMMAEMAKYAPGRAKVTPIRNYMEPLKQAGRFCPRCQKAFDYNGLEMTFACVNPACDFNYVVSERGLQAYGNAEDPRAQVRENPLKVRPSILATLLEEELAVYMDEDGIAWYREIVE